MSDVQITVSNEGDAQVISASLQETQITSSVPGIQGPVGQGFPSGGTTNQVLFKQSNTSYDAVWGFVTSSMIGDLEIVNTDVAANAAIAGTKISPNFGSQNVITTGTNTAASFIPTSSTVPTNGVYLPSANSVAISTGGSGRLFVDASGNVGVGTASLVNNPGYGGLTMNGADGAILSMMQGGSETLRVTNATGYSFINTTGATPLLLGTAGNERLRITSAGLVGIGTSSVTGTNTRLEVSNDSAEIKVSSTPAFNANFRGFRIGITGDSTDYSGIRFQPNSGELRTEAGFATWGGFQTFYTNGSERLRITSAGLVGVGTSSPSSIFHARLPGTTSATIATFDRSDGAVASEIHYDGSDGRITFGTTTNHPLSFETNNTRAVTIDTSQRVGIGTSSPSYNLQVAETSAVVSAASYSTFFGQGTRADLVLQATSSNNDQQRQVIRSNSDSLIFGTENAAVTTFTEKLRIDSTGQIEASSLGTAAAPVWSFLSDPNTGIYSPGADQVAISTGGSGRLFVDASGNVGVGLSSPAATFGKAGSVDANGILVTRGAINAHQTNAGIFQYNGNETAIRSYGATAGTGAIVFNTGGGGGSADTERLRITSAGLVGVGTSSPDVLLDAQAISGNAKIQAKETTTSKRIQLEANTAYHALYADGAVPVYHYSNGSIALTIDSSQRVGIGTSSPLNSLDVLGNNAQTIRVGSQNGDLAILSMFSNGNATWSLASDTVLRFRKDSTEYMRINSSGNVGIGTTIPSVALDVVGQIKTSLLFNANGEGFIRGDTAGQLTIQGGTSGTAFTNNANNATRLYITDGGNVGIGTTSPTDAQLYVNSSAIYGVRINHATLPLQSFLVNGTQAFSIGANNGGGGSFYYGTGNVEAARIDSSGRLLVGTSSALTGATAQYSKNVNLGNSANASGNAVLAIGRGAAATSISSGNQIGSIYFTDNGAGEFASIDCFADAAPGTNDFPGRLVFSTTADGASSPTERLRITSAGLVGVGTSAPGSILSINGTINAGNEGGLKVVNNVANASFGHGLIVQMPNFSSAWGGDDNYSIAKFTDAAGTAAFIGGARSYFRGSVGIGTTSPQHLLDCASIGRFTGNTNSAASGAGIEIGYDAGNTTGFIQSYNRGSSTYLSTAVDGSDVRFKTSGSERARIDSSGRLGIGTSSPGSLLDVGSGSAVGVTQLTLKGGAAGGDYGIFSIQNGSTPRGRLVADAAVDALRIDTAASANGKIQFYTGASYGHAVTIDSSQRVGIGTTSPAQLLHLKGSGDTKLLLNSANNASDRGIYFATSTDNEVLGYIKQEYTTGQLQISSGTGTYSSEIAFNTSGFERARVDTSGRLLVGTSTSPSSGNGQYARFVVQSNTLGAAGYISLQRNQSATLPLTNTSELGHINFGDNAGNSFASIQAFADADTANNDYPGRLVFSTTADGASSPTERMRIVNNGGIYIGKTDGTMSVKGVAFEPYATTRITTDSTGVDEVCLYLNRQSSDGVLLKFFQENTEEGNISVSGTTVSYNGAHLSRWSQLPSGAKRTEILRGSVLSNIDEMCEWGEEDNEQLNRMKVSDVEGDKNVSGVFQAWDDDDDTYTNDFYCAMTGDFIIRIGAGITVERGDLLMSAGDGTAKPQDDDIIRSKTIAKVTSTNVTCTYDDGSFCVPCVLMAC